MRWSADTDALVVLHARLMRKQVSNAGFKRPSFGPGLWARGLDRSQNGDPCYMANHGRARLYQVAFEADAARHG